MFHQSLCRFLLFCWMQICPQNLKVESKKGSVHQSTMSGNMQLWIQVTQTTGDGKVSQFKSTFFKCFLQVPILLPVEIGFKKSSIFGAPMNSYSDVNHSALRHECACSNGFVGWEYAPRRTQNCSRTSMISRSEYVILSLKR
jgi:hypothetical protein